MTFAALMRQECGWFDDDDHSSGALSARLTGDAANLQGVINCLFYFFSQSYSNLPIHTSVMLTQQVIGFPLSVILQSISTFVIGICISFTYSVKLTFVCLAAVPFSLLTVLLEAKY